jgi:hypothetical protein
MILGTKQATALAGLLLAAGPASGAIIFSDFGAGGSYSNTGPLVTDGADGPTIGDQAVAADFTSSGTYTLSSIELGFSPGQLTNNGTFDFSINTNNGGVPGATLESWDNVQISFNFNTYPTEELTSVVHPSLQAGQTYWVIALAENDIAKGAWYFNNNGPTGWLVSTNQGASWTANTVASTPAFEVDGVAVPEPTSIGVAVMGGWGFMARRRRMTRKDNLAKT